MQKAQIKDDGKKKVKRENKEKGEMWEELAHVTTLRHYTPSRERKEKEKRETESPIGTEHSVQPLSFFAAPFTV